MGPGESSGLSSKVYIQHYDPQRCSICHGCLSHVTGWMMPLRSLLAYARDVQHGALLSMCTLHSTVACCHSGLSIISACLICGYTFADDDLPLFCGTAARGQGTLEFWV